MAAENELIESPDDITDEQIQETFDLLDLVNPHTQRHMEYLAALGQPADQVVYWIATGADTR